MKTSAFCVLTLSATALGHITKPKPTESLNCVEGEHDWICQGPVHTTTPAPVTTTPEPVTITQASIATSSSQEHEHGTSTDYQATTTASEHSHESGHAHATGAPVASNGTTPAATSSPVPFEGAAMRVTEERLVGMLAAVGIAVVGWIL